MPETALVLWHRRVLRTQKSGHGRWRSSVLQTMGEEEVTLLAARFQTLPFESFECVLKGNISLGHGNPAPLSFPEEPLVPEFHVTRPASQCIERGSVRTSPYPLIGSNAFTGVSLGGCLPRKRFAGGVWLSSESNGRVRSGDTLLLDASRTGRPGEWLMGGRPGEWLMGEDPPAARDGLADEGASGGSFSASSSGASTGSSSGAAPSKSSAVHFPPWKPWSRS